VAEALSFMLLLSLIIMMGKTVDFPVAAEEVVWVPQPDILMAKGLPVW
jgi:hypothetical protein